MLGSILRRYSVHMDSTGPSVEKKLRGCRTLEDSHLLPCSEGSECCCVQKDSEVLPC